MANIFSRILQRFNPTEKRSISDRQLRDLIRSGAPSSAGVSINEKTALAISAVYACTKVLAESYASLPLHLFERQSDGSRVRVTDNPIIPLLTVSPNQHMTAYEWRELIMFGLCLRGNSFNRIQRNGHGEPVAIHPMHPDNITMKVTEGGELVYDYSPRARDAMRIPARDVLHFKGLSADGLIGLSPLDVMAETMGHNYAMQSYGARLFANDARPSGVLTHPGVVDDEVYDRIKESWNEAHTAANQHSVAFLEDGVGYEPIGISPEHAQFLGSRQLGRSEISGGYRVPAHMIGDLDKATFSNIEKQDLFFAKHTMTPICEGAEQAMNMKLITPDKQGSYYLEHSLEGLLRGDIQTRYSSYALLWDRGVISANEIRELENMPPTPDGDTYYIPLNFVAADETVVPALNPDRSKPMQYFSAPGCGQDHGTPVRALPAGITKLEVDLDEKVKVAKARTKLIASFQPVLEDAMRRVVKREAQQILSAAKKHLNRSKQEFTDFLYVFYQDTAYTEQQVAPAFEALRQAVGNDVYREINEEWDDNPALRAWAEKYIETFAAHHALSSRSQLDKLVAETEQDLYEVLEQRMLEWQEGGPSGTTRAVKISAHEITRFGNAFMMVAAAGAVADARFVWRAVGETCPICIDMDGTTVGFGESFTDGKQSNLKDANGEPFMPSGPTFQPPLHAGCDCVITLE